MRSKAWHGAAWSFAALLLSALLVAGAGILTIQRNGLNAGAVYGLDNQIRSVRTSGPALPHLVVIALLAAAVLFALRAAIRRLPRPQALLFGAVWCGATLVQIAAAFVMLATDYAPRRLEAGYRPWWLGWVETGGTSPATLVAFLVSLGLLWNCVRPTDRASGRPERNAERPQLRS